MPDRRIDEVAVEGVRDRDRLGGRCVRRSGGCGFCLRRRLGSGSGFGRRGRRSRSGCRRGRRLGRAGAETTDVDVVMVRITWRVVAGLRRVVAGARRVVAGARRTTRAPTSVVVGREACISSCGLGDRRAGGRRGLSGDRVVAERQRGCGGPERGDRDDCGRDKPGPRACSPGRVRDCFSPGWGRASERGIVAENC